MQIRFLQTSASDNPEFPFQAGQIITVPRLSDRMKAAIKAGAAQVLREVADAAVLGPTMDTAALPRAQGRR